MSAPDSPGTQPWFKGLNSQNFQWSLYILSIDTKMSCYDVLCLHHSALVSHHATYLPSLSFQSNANVLQPSAQQRRLRLVLRAGFLLTDVKPPGGRQATASL